MNSIPVLIVGAGPTGLSMAIELYRYGIPFRIIDKSIKPVSTSNALAVQTRTLEVWDDLGLLESALNRGVPISGANIFAKNQKIATLTLSHLNSSFHFLLGLSQHQTEVMLIEYLKNKNIFLEFETTITCIESQSSESLLSQQKLPNMEVTLLHANGSEERLSAEWIIACDGAHSQIRKLCHLDFVGKELMQHFVLADLKLKSDLMKNQLNIFMSPKGILAIVPFDETYSRIIADVSHDRELKAAKSLTFAQVQRLVKERCPVELEMQEPIWTSGFWIHARMAKDFQVGRIFFAGDAAHIHSPAGGQGMNTGIQDANNLAWKLAFVLKGMAKEKILETYSIERESVAKNVLQRTTAFTKIMTLQNYFLQTIRNVAIKYLLKNSRVQAYVLNTLAQLNIQYPKNNLVVDFLGSQPGPRAGTRVLDFHEQLFEYIHGSHFSLICFMGSNDQADVAVYYDLTETLKKHFNFPINYILVRVEDSFQDWPDFKIYDADKKLHEIYGAVEPCVYLIRPDKYVGFRGSLNHLEQLNKLLSL